MDRFELYWCESAEASLPSPAVAGGFDPDDDRDAELVAGGPALLIEDVLLQQREERLGGGVVATRANASHRSDHVELVQRRHEGPGSD